MSKDNDAIMPERQPESLAVAAFWKKSKYEISQISQSMIHRWIRDTEDVVHAHGTLIWRLKRKERVVCEHMDETE